MKKIGRGVLIISKILFFKKIIKQEWKDLILLIIGKRDLMGGIAYTELIEKKRFYPPNPKRAAEEG